MIAWVPLRSTVGDLFSCINTTTQLLDLDGIGTPVPMQVTLAGLGLEFVD